MIISILELLPTLIVTSPSTSLYLFCNSCFESLIFSNRTSIKYSGATINTSKVHINNLYIKYTLVHSTILLIHQIFRVFPFLVTISFAVQALSFRLWFSFGLLRGSDNLLVILLEVPFLSLCPFLENSDLVNHQHLMLFLDFYLHRFHHHEKLESRFRHPLHTIVHHKVLVTW